MKQHHQRILRLWRCPECDRTVRLPGRITSRTCRCMGQQTMMQLQETDRIRKFDIDSFVSYQTDEDVTPTAAELVEEIPKHLMPIGPTDEEIAAKAAKPRRGKAYLRTEVDQETEAKGTDLSPKSKVDDFGAGIENELPEKADRRKTPDTNTADTNTAAEADSPSSHSDKDSEGSTEATGRKRKRRRKRRSRSAGRREGDSNGESKSADDTIANDTIAKLDHVAAPTNVSAAGNGAASTISENVADAQASPAEANSDSAPAAGKKRRRRRRRRGKGGGSTTAGSEGGNTNGNTSDSPAGDSPSAPAE